MVRQTVDDSLLGRPHVAEKAFSTEATKVMPKGEKTPDERFADLQDMTRGYLTDEEEAKLEKAFRFAASAHEGACRKSGEPFIAHPVEVAIILAQNLRIGRRHAVRRRFCTTPSRTPTRPLDGLEQQFGSAGGRSSWTACTKITQHRGRHASPSEQAAHHRARCSLP